MNDSNEKYSYVGLQTRVTSMAGQFARWANREVRNPEGGTSIEEVYEPISDIGKKVDPCLELIVSRVPLIVDAL
jgi:hypothetical protein